MKVIVYIRCDLQISNLNDIDLEIDVICILEAGEFLQEQVMQTY